METSLWHFHEDLGMHIKDALQSGMQYHYWICLFSTTDFY